MTENSPPASPTSATDSRAELRERIRRWADSPEGLKALQQTCADINATTKEMESMRLTRRDLMDFHVDRIEQ